MSCFFARVFLFAVLTAAATRLCAQHLQVRDEADAPLIGATVELLPGDSAAQSRPARVAVTDAEGRVELSDLRAGRQDRLRIRSIGYAPTLVYPGQFRDLPPSASLTVVLRPAQALLTQAVVTAVRARPSDPFAFVNLDGRRLADANPGQDIPFLLRRTPGVVYTSDAGNGVGYTGIRVRGADPTRVNVTVNGVPFNNPESQGVFWVNFPDLISSVSSLQIQRGVGESTYGAGAFGANLNLVTRAPLVEPALTGELGGGSFGTARAMLRANSGTFGPGLSVEARASLIRSDGYVDRASSRLGSAFLSAAWAISDRQRLQVLGTHGHERTYQSWYGIPAAFAADPARRTYNPAGLRSDGSFYEDQVDDYRQTHAQLSYSASLRDGWLMQLTGHYTHGQGYYEEWRNGDRLGRYFPQSPAADSVTDLVRRLWLDNDFFGAIATLSGRLSPKLDLTFSAGADHYYGDHFTAIPVINSPEFADQTAGRVFGNDATKTDANAFAKLNYRITDGISLYGDLQLRFVDYELAASRDRNVDRRTRRYNFFNPKLGFTAALPSWSVAGSDEASVFASAAVGQREPNRNDFIDAPMGRVPAPEQLYDFELGLRSPQSGRLRFDATAYFMYYRDQLALTGRLNEVGEAIRINIPRSHRLGLELSSQFLVAERASTRATHAWSLDANVALSDSRVERFEEAIDNFATGEQDILIREGTSLAFSPRLIGNGGVLYALRGTGGCRLDVALWGNVVSRQYLDNSERRAASLPGYGSADLELRFSPARRDNAVLFTLQLQNLTAAKNITNGYVYRYNSPGYDPRPDDSYSVIESGDTYLYKGVYPQAGFQVLAGLRVTLAKR